MTKEEFRVMKRLVPQLLRHMITAASSQDTPSMLAKLQGIFKYKLNWQPCIYFMLMTNSAQLACP